MVKLRGRMPFELDHFMLFVPDPAAAAALVELDLRVGHTGPQPGTGAGHTVFFFDNTYIEIVWPEPGRDPFIDAPAMHIAERCRDQRWCAFGLAVRPIGPPPSPLPIRTWDYTAPFLPRGAIPIPIAANSGDAEEPLIVLSLVSRRPDRRSDAPALQRSFREVTAARVLLPGTRPFSPELEALVDLVPLSIGRGETTLVLELDGGLTGRRLDLRPRLPLMMTC